MATTKRTWLWVVLGVMGTMALVVVLVVVGAIVEFRRHVHNDYVDGAVAEQQFDAERARFAGQEPLVQFSGRDDVHRGDFERRDDVVVHRPPAGAARVPIHRLRVLVYDTNNGHLIHADIPGWLLRMMPSGRGGVINSDFGDFDMSRNRNPREELAPHGPALGRDGRNRDSRILVWSE